MDLPFLSTILRPTTRSLGSCIQNQWLDTVIGSGEGKLVVVEGAWEGEEGEVHGGGR